VYIKLFKRTLDLLISLLGLLVLSPIFVIIFLSLFIANSGFPFFFQKRPGQYNRIFSIIKFKTMNDQKDALGNLLPDAQRLTSIGSFVRKTSLDEIPQLINVLKGDMSLVGPRPLLVQYLPLYTDEQKRRHLLKPGITGWAQVNGRNAISWEEKFKLDVWYVDHQTFWLDMKILYLTLIKVFKREGITDKDGVTMSAFKGN